jgi:hypothetical protein
MCSTPQRACWPSRLYCCCSRVMRRCCVLPSGPTAPVVAPLHEMSHKLGAQVIHGPGAERTKLRHYYQCTVSAILRWGKGAPQEAVDKKSTAHQTRPSQGVSASGTGKSRSATHHQDSCAAFKPRLRERQAIWLRLLPTPKASWQCGPFRPRATHVECAHRTLLGPQHGATHQLSTALSSSTTCSSSLLVAQTKVVT